MQITWGRLFRPVPLNTFPKIQSPRQHILGLSNEFTTTKLRNTRQGFTHVLAPTVPF